MAAVALGVAVEAEMVFNLECSREGGEACEGGDVSCP